MERRSKCGKGANNIVTRGDALFGLGAHSDDLAFSLGAALWDGRLAGCRPVTVFSRSGYTLKLPNGDPDRVSALRKAEDKKFFSLTGADVLLWLDQPDAPLRRAFVSDTVFSAPLSEDELAAVYGKVVSAIPGSATLLAPLALGGHVDHRTVLGVACRLYVQGSHEVFFYEDLPYAAFMELPALEARVHALERELGITLRPIFWPSLTLHSAKQWAVESYASQCDEYSLDPLLYHSQRLHSSALCGERVWIPSRYHFKLRGRGDGLWGAESKPLGTD